MQTFKKNERLANYRLQSMLFSKGNFFFHYPFRVQWLCFSKNDQYIMQSSQGRPVKNAVFRYPAKCMIAISKRHIKSAVKRNLVKRLAREAYRKNKSGLYSFLEMRELLAMVAFVYTAKEVMAYKKVEPAIREALQRLQEKINTCGVKDA